MEESRRSKASFPRSGNGRRRTSQDVTMKTENGGGLRTPVSSFDQVSIPGSVLKLMSAEAGLAFKEEVWSHV